MTKILAILNGVILLILVGLLHKINSLDNTIKDLKTEIAYNQQHSDNYQNSTSSNYSPNNSKNDALQSNLSSKLNVELIRQTVQSELNQWAQNNQLVEPQKNSSTELTYEQLSDTAKQKRDDANVVITGVLARTQISQTDLERVYLALRHLPSDERKSILRNISQRTNTGSLKFTD